MTNPGKFQEKLEHEKEVEIEEVLRKQQGKDV